MKLPRDISGQELMKLLKKSYAYEKTRQVESHIRVTTYLNSEHHITIPDHSPVRIGTLNMIINDVAKHFQASKEEVMANLFG